MGNAPGPGAVSKRLEQRRSAGEAAQRELESDDEFFEPLEDVAAPPDATLDELSGDFREMLSVLRSSAAPEDALAGALETVRLTDDAEELDGTTHAIARSAATAREAQSAPSAQLPPQSTPELKAGLSAELTPQLGAQPTPQPALLHPSPPTTEPPARTPRATAHTAVSGRPPSPPSTRSRSQKLKAATRGGAVTDATHPVDPTTATTATTATAATAATAATIPRATIAPVAPRAMSTVWRATRAVPSGAAPTAPSSPPTSSILLTIRFDPSGAGVVLNLTPRPARRAAANEGLISPPPGEALVTPLKPSAPTVPPTALTALVHDKRMCLHRKVYTASHYYIQSLTTL